jgi:hypothetical protein
MKVVAVKDIVRKDVPIYYRLLYTGVAALELSTESAGSPSDYRIDFAIEIKPTGQKDITVSFLDDVGYPLIPLIKELKKQIDLMHSNGQLPD